MAFLDFLLGEKAKTKQFQTTSPQQQQYYNQLLSQGQQQLPVISQYLQSLLSQAQEPTEAFTAPAMRQFQEQIVPTIAERFSGLNAQKSSAFGQQLGQAGAGLAENLAALRESQQAQRAGIGMGAAGQLQGLLSPAFGQQFENVYMPRQPGFLENLLGSLLGAGGQLGTMYGAKKLGIF